jgi:putative ABC transport system substrate-binding protein
MGMRRREFLGVLGGAAAAWPLAARAQAERVRRVAALFGASGAEVEEWFAAFRSRLDELGWTPERNIRLEVRYGEGSAEQIRRGADELLTWSPDVIFVFNNLALAVLKPLAANTPIVFAGIGDPVGSGFVASLARPGGNITGFEAFVTSMGGKWLEVLKETAPHITRAIAILHPETPAQQGFWHSMQSVASQLGMEVTFGPVHNASEIEAVMSAVAAEPNSGVVSLPHAVTTANDRLMVALELRYRLPAIHSIGNDGSLVSYGLSWVDVMRRAAGYVDRILRGAKAADLPVQAPTKFEFVINLTTAKALGLTFPPGLLALANEVVE